MAKIYLHLSKGMILWIVTVDPSIVPNLFGVILLAAKEASTLATTCVIAVAVM